MSAEPSVASLVEAKLASSGLSVGDAKKLGFVGLTAKQVHALDATNLAYPALKLPYTTVDGKPTGFYRLRYLGELNGFDALRRKPPRYVQPADTTVEVFYSSLGVRWKPVLADPNAAVFLTEGELKAACACKLGYPTIGLGGVWSWRSARKGIALVDSLRQFSWKGRPAYLVFDSDFAVKPDVMRALIALARELTALGAQPYLVTLPELDDVAKTGLDDFLVARGADAFDEVVRAATPYATAAELWRLNEEILYVRDPGLVVVLADGRRLSPKSFKEHAYANRHYLETTVTAKGETKSVKKPLAPAWLEWESRAEALKLTYDPGAGRVVAGAYNYWPGWGVEPKRGDVAPWRELLDYLFRDAEREARTWFERWLAFPIRYPGTKLYTSAVMWGRGQGTGKSLIGYTMRRIYGRNFAEIDDQHLASPFNEWAECKQFVMGDDVTGAEYKKTVQERLKSMITREELRLNLKYLPSFVIPDRVNYYFTSQHPDAFVLDDQDRRYFVHEAPREPLADEFYSRYDAWYRGDGAAAVFDHLLRLDLGDFNPKGRALRTAAKDAMTLDSKSDLGAWVAQLHEHPDSLLKFGDAGLTSDLYTSAQLLALYDPAGTKRVTANGLGRELKRAGLPQVRGGATIATAKGPVRLYAVRNATKWERALPTRIAAHYDDAFAPSDPKKPKY